MENGCPHKSNVGYAALLGDTEPRCTGKSRQFVPRQEQDTTSAKLGHAIQPDGPQCAGM